MTMFEELYALATSATLTMTLSADEKSGRLTINVIPKPRKDVGEPALAQPLSLTATPQEFDAGFIEILRGYREDRRSLAQQAEATKEVIEAAKAASVKKASEATAKAKASPAKPPSSAKSADGDGRDDTPTPEPAAAAPAAADNSTYNLFG